MELGLPRYGKKRLKLLSKRELRGIRKLNRDQIPEGWRRLHSEELSQIIIKLCGL
jgi:hypothetical protein